MTVTGEIKKLKEDAAGRIKNKERPSCADSAKSFFNNGAASLYFIFSEKENILFAFLQLAFIALGYYLWVQMLDWIPQSVWDNMKNSDDGDPLLNIALLVWSFACVGIVAYPLGILTACMGASYILRFQGRPSTIAECLKVVLGKSWTLWIFSWLDGWWTVERILERLPKKKDRTPRSVKLANEAAYQAWKLASLGFIPATICGRSLSEACKDSLSLLKDRFLPLIKLRIAYSLICWIFGIGSYIGVFLMFPYIDSFAGAHNNIYSFYFFAGFPAVVALTFIMLVFRPIYIISACRIYAFYAREKEIEIKLPQTSPAFISALAAFCVLAVILATVFLYRDELGLSAILSGTSL